MKKVKKGKSVCFVCQTCYFAYKDKDVAEQCEAYCAAHNSCNPAITEKAITNLNIGQETNDEVKELGDIDDEE